MKDVKSHPQFKCLRKVDIESLHLIVYEFEHTPTGAKHYHLAADNDENVFLVGLRTVPIDSTGVAHILEHTALCGSERYPVRDPFFMMLRRSLNTFMNAFTSSDWTAYPFASQNKKDFNNLLDVYLDATFFSRLDPLDFAQEGHRLEFKEAENADSELVYRGVVYNEMKGAMSSPVDMLWHTLCNYMYPTTTYHYNSGGEPEQIPNLSYQQLKTFYDKHYHPSNATFMTYGNIPAHEHQQRFTDAVLKRFQKDEDIITIPREKRYYAPVYAEESYPLSTNEKLDNKTHIVMSWLLDESSNFKRLLEAHLLSDVLLANSASPLLKALETTELATSPSPLLGLEESNKEMCFVCGVEGSEREHAEQIEQLILNVLEDVATNGVPYEKLAAVLHQLELRQREIRGDSYPYGLQLILTALPAAIHRGDPIALLNLDPVLEELREAIRDPEYIKRLTRELLLDNPHRVRLVLKPDHDFEAKREARLADILAEKKNALTDSEKEHIVLQAQTLAKRQQQQDDPSILPKVTLDDIPKTLSYCEPTEKNETDGTQESYYAQGTNGLTYQDVMFAVPSLSESEQAIMPYYSDFLTELGCGRRDYLAMQDWQSQVSGGIGSSFSIKTHLDDPSKLYSHFILSGKALARNQSKLTELLSETWKKVNFTEHDRIRDLLEQKVAEEKQRVTGHGHALAMLVATACFSPLAELQHRVSGLPNINHAQSLLDTIKQDDKAIETFSNELQAMHERLQNQPRECLLISESDQIPTLSRALANYWGSIDVKDESTPFTLNSLNTKPGEIWLANTQVNFCAKAYPVVGLTHADAAPLAVLSHFLRNGFLHRVIREQGGAYGGGANYSAELRAFRLFSYRDPRLTETLDDFDKALEWLATNDHAPHQVEEAILGVISAMDKPNSPAGEARKAYYNDRFGRTMDIRQDYRKRVLNVELEDLQRVAKEYLTPERASVAVITNESIYKKCGDLGLDVQRLR